MNRNLAMLFSSVGIIVALASAQGPRTGGFGGLRPPTENERGLRQLTPEEIPPNLNYYAMDPLYDPNAVLGWSPTRIEEKLNRGMLALPTDLGHVYLGWRLLKDDPQDVTFNVYRSTAGEGPTKLNDRPNRGSYKFDGYSGRTGAFLWRIDLGWNVDMGIWWTRGPGRSSSAPTSRRGTTS